MRLKHRRLIANAIRDLVKEWRRYHVGQHPPNDRGILYCCDTAEAMASQLAGDPR